MASNDTPSDHLLAVVSHGVICGHSASLQDDSMAYQTGHFVFTLRVP